MPKINLYSPEWCDMVFEGRNKNYGAYPMRQQSSSRHRVALIATIIFFILAFTLPKLIKSIIPEKKEQNVTVTSLSDIELEKLKKKAAEEVKVEKPKEEAVKVKETIKYVPPVIKADRDVKEEEMKTVEEVVKSDVSISVADVKGSKDADAIDVADLQKDQAKVVEEPVQKPFTVVEQMPEFPGGESALNKFLKDNIRYPSVASENGISGSVYLTFVVSKEGKISDVRVLRGIGGGCDEEAVRVVRMMPPWIAGRQNGVSVPVQFNLPVRFVLQ
jgi:periplasmic protein TonB